MLRKLKPQDKLNFFNFANKHNINVLIFNDFIKNKKLAFIEEQNDNIKGLVYLKKTDKHYIHLCFDSKLTGSNLLKIFFWNFKKDVYAKIEQKDKTGFLLKEQGFRIIDKQNTTFILYYDSNKRNKRYGKRDNS